MSNVLDDRDELAYVRDELAYVMERKDKKIEVLSYEKERFRIMYETAFAQLLKIHNLLCAEDFVVDDKRYSFHPPDALVLESWKALSKAIREIALEPRSDDDLGDLVPETVGQA